jgi:hypothetical protein
VTHVRIAFWDAVSLAMIALVPVHCHLCLAKVVKSYLNTVDVVKFAKPILVPVPFYVLIVINIRASAKSSAKFVENTTA